MMPSIRVKREVAQYWPAVMCKQSACSLDIQAEIGASVHHHEMNAPPDMQSGGVNDVS